QLGVCAPGTPVVCDDGLFCNGPESCLPAQGCIAGVPPVLDDAVPCTVDACNEDSDRVDHTPTNSLCGGGFVCNAAAGCVDVDECATGTANCGPDSTCANTNGGFTCTLCLSPSPSCQVTVFRDANLAGPSSTLGIGI